MVDACGMSNSRSMAAPTLSVDTAETIRDERAPGLSLPNQPPANDEPGERMTGCVKVPGRLHQRRNASTIRICAEVLSLKQTGIAHRQSERIHRSRRTFHRIMRARRLIAQPCRPLRSWWFSLQPSFTSRRNARSVRRSKRIGPGVQGRRVSRCVLASRRTNSASWFLRPIMKPKLLDTLTEPGGRCNRRKGADLHVPLPLIRAKQRCERLEAPGKRVGDTVKSLRDQLDPSRRPG